MSKSKAVAELKVGLPVPADFVDFDDSDHKRPSNTLTNARVAVAKLEEQGMSFTYDTFRDKRYAGNVELTNELGQISDEAISGLQVMVRKLFNFEPGQGHMWSAVMLRCREHSYHPVRDYLAGLGEFFGRPQLETWMIEYLGVADTKLVRYVSKMVLVASVRRIKQPGCKYDYMIVLEGPENKGKSLGIETLYGAEFFSDQTLLGLKDKELQETTEGRWAIECQELVGMRKDVEKIKAQITRTTDRARKAYARSVLDFPRQCVLWGTTNESDYLRSQTGNRRFIPIRVPGMVNISGLQANRDALWCEAVELEATGFPIWMPEHLWTAAQAEQSKRTRRDPLRDRLEDLSEYIPANATERGVYWLRDDEERVSSKWIMDEVLHIAVPDQTSEFASRLRLAMEANGWEHDDAPMRIGKKLLRGYRRPVKDFGI
jgi:predicted P-loop ATPase